MAVLPDGTVTRPAADRTPASLKFHHKHYQPVLDLIGTGYTTAAAVAAHLNITVNTAETELRAMTARGWLHMWAEKDRTVTPVKFIEYRWEQA
jgi:hypothetical protein